MKILDFPQGSPEWHAIRCGIPTASNFDNIITSKGLPSKQREKFLYKLAGERITKIADIGFKSPTMELGSVLEAEARQVYEFATDSLVDTVGFCLEGMWGCSPDGMVGKDGLIEIKCPLMSTHVSYLLKNRVPPDYIPQIQGQLFVTGRQWCDFMSYYPGLRPLIIRVNRDEPFIKLLEKELISFCDELEKVVEVIK